MLTDQSQQIVWQAAYDPFGQATLLVNTVENNVRFPGQYYDAETSLHYNYFRYYDPGTGRYLTSDPIGLAGGVNTYGYVEGNPLMYTDPTGETPVGMALGFGIELGMQLTMNRGNWGCVDWTDVAVSTLVGAVAPGFLSTGKTVLTSSKATKVLSEQAYRARTANRLNKGFWGHSVLM